MSTKDILRTALELIREHGFQIGGMHPERDEGIGLAMALTMAAADGMGAITAADKIRRANGIEHLVDWELAHGRTQAEVEAALTKAI